MRHPLVLALLAAGCSNQDFHVVNVPPPSGDLHLSGRVCNPATHTWLANALVYTELYDRNHVVYDSRSTTTDTDGKWTLDELAPNMDYEVYVQVGHDVLDQFVVTLADADGTLPDPQCTGNAALNVAVITGSFDELEPLLQAIGVTGVKVIDGQSGSEITDFLTDPVAMSEYDVVLFDGGAREDGVIYGSGPVDQVKQNVHDYVDQGGIVFASDWAYDVVEQIWPDEMDFYGDDTVPNAAQVGDVAVVDAKVIDHALSQALGTDSVDVTYDLPVWPVIESVSSDVNVYLQGDAPWRHGLDSGQVENSPLVAGFDAGSGRVVMTTYRGSANTSQELLSVLVDLLTP